MHYDEIDYNSIRKKFIIKFSTLLNRNLKVKDFFYEIFAYGTAYVVGGFLRDIILDKETRDLDIIIGLPTTRVKELLTNTNLNYKINRMNGIKILLDNYEIDTWCIENNWAFNNKLVVKNDDNILESIANGCFYNYDSLVINIHSKKMNIKNFLNFLKYNQLDIIQKNDKYKSLNPTIEANILKAFYIRKVYNVNFDENCNNYIISRIGFLNDKFGNALIRLNDMKRKYEKYDKVLTENDIISSIEYSKKIQSKNVINF